MLEHYVSSRFDLPEVFRQLILKFQISDVLFFKTHLDCTWTDGSPVVVLGKMAVVM